MAQSANERQLLSKLFALHSDNLDVQAAVSSVLNHMAMHAALRFALVDQGAVPKLVGLMQSRSEKAQYRAVKAIAHIGKHMPFRPKLVAAGALEPLSLLCLSNNRKVQGMAAGTLANLCAEGTALLTGRLPINLMLISFV